VTSHHIGVAPEWLEIGLRSDAVPPENAK